MKATDRQLIDISEELTAHIMKPTSDLHLDHEQCIILNRLISEEFERRQEQDVMGSSNGQDTSLGQSGADNNDVTLDASERRDSEVSGVEVRKKKPQITKVSKKEYWDNRDKHGAISIDIYKFFGHSFDDKSLNFGGMPLLDKYIPIAWMEERIRVNKKFPCSTLFEGYDAVYQSVIDSWEAFGRNDWCKDVHDEC